MMATAWAWERKLAERHVDACGAASAVSVMTTAEMHLRALARPPRRLLRRARSFLIGGAVILLYHRVYDADFDPWLLSVSPKNFDDQMAHLRRHYALLSLPELRQTLAAGRVPRAAVAVTFDDGYGDNLRNAKPILERHRVPATVFVTSGYVGAQREFWWDELERVVLHAPRVPEQLAVTYPGLDSNLGDRRRAIDARAGAARRSALERRASG